MDKKIYTENKYIWLLISLIIFLVLTPFRAMELPGADFISSVAYTCILGTAIYACRQDKHMLIFTAILSFPAVVSYWFHSSHSTNSPEILLGSGTAFYICYICVITKEMLTSSQTIYNKLAASLCTYLMIGISFAYAYTLIELKMPGSFVFPDTSHLEHTTEQVIPHIYDLIYHSYVTLSTLGYGDIQPRSTLTRTLCIAEALFGQIYLVVIVASIVNSANQNDFHPETRKK